MRLGNGGKGAIIDKELLERATSYRNYLNILDSNKLEYVTISMIARAVRVEESVVCDDLAKLSGKREERGFVLKTILNQVNSFLGVRDGEAAAVIDRKK